MRLVRHEVNCWRWCPPHEAYEYEGPSGRRMVIGVWSKGEVLIYPGSIDRLTGEGREREGFLTAQLEVAEKLGAS